MPLDSQERAAAIWSGLGIGQAIFSSIQGLGPGPYKAVDFAPVIGAKPGGTLFLVLEEVNDPVHHAEDLIPILDLDPEGNMGKSLKFADQLIRDFKD